MKAPASARSGEGRMYTTVTSNSNDVQMKGVEKAKCTHPYPYS